MRTDGGETREDEDEDARADETGARGRSFVGERKEREGVTSFVESAVAGGIGRGGEDGRRVHPFRLASPRRRAWTRDS